MASTGLDNEEDGSMPLSDQIDNSSHENHSPAEGTLAESTFQEGSNIPQPTPRPFVAYSKRSLLLLSRSPLVKPPAGMPELKEWFGYDYHLCIALCSSRFTRADNEQNLHKRDSEPTTPNSARERR